MPRETSKWQTHKDESTDARHRGGATRSSEEVCESRQSKGVASFSFGCGSTAKREEPMSEAKPFEISKQVVWEAYKRVKANKGAAGVDDESVEEFERNLKNNLYKIWNRMSSGTYFPPPVKTVIIPKQDGGERKLGVPTISDRIAQMVVKRYLEPVVEPHFHPDSYGYRPKKSAIEAVGVARKRCWRFDWAIDLDIKGFFGAPGQAWRFQRVQFPSPARGPATSPGIEPWAHGGDNMG
jgi:hypothetical protein